MNFRKQGLTRILCLFIIFSLLGGGWVSSPFFLGGQAYASELSNEVLGNNDIAGENGDREEGSGESDNGEEGSSENDNEEGDSGENGDGEEDSEGNDDGEEGSDENDDEEIDSDGNGDGEADSDENGDEEEIVQNDGDDDNILTGDFTIIGGEAGVDYEYKEITYNNQGYGNAEGFTGYYTPSRAGSTTWKQTSLVIKTNTPLTLSNIGTTNTGIYIEPAVQADLTFAGVNINAYIPVNIVTNKIEEGEHGTVGMPTSLHLTLADGTTNTLSCTLAGTNIAAPGIRCGEGSNLTIDDGRRNVDQNGVFVAPKQGQVSRDAILADGTEVKEGDRLTILDSDNPGRLTVNGGYRSAAIGGGPMENSGDLAFNGGIITAYAYGPGDERQGAGCGIGGGHAGGGTIITVNGGTIDAKGSYHGAGFGGGCTYTGGMSTDVTYAFADAVFSKTPSSTIAGDININGGFIKSQGFTHGNAFGQGCGGTNNGKAITVTGGTLLPTSVAGWYDLGGAGGDVIVTGGSIRLSGPNKFQCAGGTAFGDLEKKTHVFMTTIDLSGEEVDGHKIQNDKISNWELLIAGKEYGDGYGAPAVFDEGKLYLWLPDSADKKEITVTLGIVKKDGTEDSLEPLFVQSANKDGTSYLKRYVNFILPEEYTKGLEKYYDGLAFDPFDLSAIENEGTDEHGIYTGEVDDKYLNDNNKVTYKAQRYDTKEGSAIGEEIELGKSMPADGGIYKFTMTSSQYSEQPDFKDSYWGHRATGWATIHRIPSKVTDATYTVTYGQDPTTLENIVTKMTFTANVKQGEEKRKTTCKAPDGNIEFYVNGVKVGEMKADTVVDKEHIDGEGDFAYGKVSLTVDFSGDNYPAIPKNEDGTFVVEAKYVGGYNYEESDSPVTKVDSEGNPEGNDKEEPENFPFINPPIPVIPNTDGDPTDPNYKPEGTELKPVETKPIVTENGENRLHGIYNDVYTRLTEEGVKVSKQDLIDFFNGRYMFVGADGRLLMGEDGKPLKTEDITITDASGNPITEIDLTNPGKYLVTTTVTDKAGNKATINLTYNVISSAGGGGGTGGGSAPDINVDIDGDGKPDINVDTDGDGKPDINVDTNGDGKPDVNVDTNGDGKPDINVDTDGDGKPDINVDTNGDSKPDVNVDTDGDGKPDINVDTDGDGKPDINVDTDGDGKPDVNVDTNGDGKPDINVDTDGDGKPDVNVDTDGDGKPDINVDTDGDGKPDINVDTDGDGKPDINVDTDGDGKPDINVDTDGDGKPDLNVDTDGDGIPDLNVDIDGDGIPDINIDTDGDGIPDKNIKNPSEIEKLLKEKGGQDGVHGRVPKTGDENNLLAWLAMLGAAIAVLAGTMRKMRRKDS